MKNRSRLLGVGMLVLALAFILYALHTPQGSWPWPNSVTHFLYGLYLLVTLVLLAPCGRPKDRR